MSRSPARSRVRRLGAYSRLRCCLLTSLSSSSAFSTDPELEVKYSGHPVDMHQDYPPLLRKIQDMVEEKLGVKFNHAFLNLYEDGKIYIGNHRDNRENRCVRSPAAQGFAADTAAGSSPRSRWAHLAPLSSRTTRLRLRLLSEHRTTNQQARHRPLLPCFIRIALPSHPARL